MTQAYAPLGLMGGIPVYENAAHRTGRWSALNAEGVLVRYFVGGAVKHTHAVNQKVDRIFMNRETYNAIVEKLRRQTIRIVA